MPFEAWSTSASHAWQRPLVRWATVAIAIMVAAGLVFFLWRVIPQRGKGDTLVLHYNLYMGIDQLGSWLWLLLLPALWVGFLLVDLLLAYGFYQRDQQLALGLVAVALGWNLPWLILLYCLTLVNT